MSKEKKVTLRQRLRNAAEVKLDSVTALMWIAANRAIDESETDLDPIDVMRYLSSSQTKTIKDKLVTQLANEAEARLEELFSKQECLPGVEQ